MYRHRFIGVRRGGQEEVLAPPLPPPGRRKWYIYCIVGFLDKKKFCPWKIFPLSGRKGCGLSCTDQFQDCDVKV